MKKYILTLAVFVLGLTQVAAQKLIVDPVVEVPQGGQAKVAIKYETEGKAIKGFGIQFVLPEGISTVKKSNGRPDYQVHSDYATGDNQFGMASANDGWTGTCTDGQLQGESGTIFYAILAADETLALNSTHEVQVTKLMVTVAEDGTNKSVYLDDFKFTIKIVENIVTLDENSTTAPEAATGVNVKVLRTIKAGNWGTICLPFAMNEAQVKEAFGDGAELADFIGFTVTERDEDDLIMSISVNFASATSIQANRPYLLKSKKEITYEEGFEVKNVDINPGTARIQMDWDDDAEAYQTWFRGTYVPTVLTNNNWLFLSGNKFYYAKKDVTKVKGFRGYFKFKNAINAKYKDISSAGVKLFIDNIPTAIDSINDEINIEGIYDMSGRKLNEMPKTKGVYIIDGKKVAIK